MKIKYIGCDGVTENVEEILSAEFYETIHSNGKTYKMVQCERSCKSIYYRENENNTFVVDFDSIESIKSNFK